jgi:hypothetical protein
VLPIQTAAAHNPAPVIPESEHRGHPYEIDSNSVTALSKYFPGLDNRLLEQAVILLDGS